MVGALALQLVGDEYGGLEIAAEGVGGNLPVEGCTTLPFDDAVPIFFPGAPRQAPVLLP